ncbi:MAG TPA: energy transducer TonB [Candidatus Sulfotelmatobacter sp.]|nr:energy transducer TonB [Candidatus Sulfotelmatobacter sp.]
MFAESILETSWAQRARRGWTTLTSLGLQILAVGSLLTLPLVKPQGLPLVQHLSTPIMLGRRPGPPPETQHSSPSHRIQSNLMNDVIVLPTSIPATVQMIQESVAPPQLSQLETCVFRCGEIGDPRIGVPGSTNPAITVAPPPPPTVTRPTVRISHMSEGDLVHKVQPVYPQLAKLAHVQGVVVLAAVISREGTIEKLRVVNGHPMLVQAAVDAVQQWRYKPYILNGDPVEVETQITVNFSLTGS